MTTRAQRAAALERWAPEDDAEDLIEAKTATLRISPTDRSRTGVLRERMAR